jgi:hypothetical protein
MSPKPKTTPTPKMPQTPIMPLKLTREPALASLGKILSMM